MFAGCCGRNELKFYDRLNGYESVSHISFRKGIYTLDSGN